MGTFFRIVLGFIGLIFAVSIANSIFGGSSPSSGSTDPRSSARYACMDAIEKNANDAKSIEWIERQNWPIVPNGEGFQVNANMRMKNGFGALMLTRIDCQVEHRGDKYYTTLIQRH
jgi:hypothetical protein